MFSYRHAFHAGNHADVLKHTVLIATLKYLTQKDAGITVIDTHAGAGLYRLDGEFAQKSAESVDGIVKLLQADFLKPKKPSAGVSIAKLATESVAKKPAKSAPPAAAAAATPTEVAQALQDYLNCIASFNPSGSLKIYPGSPFVLHQLLRSEARDKLKLFELHPADHKALAGNIAQLDAGRMVSVAREDGFEALKSMLPPPNKRALVLMDPSYEMKSDYAKVPAFVADCLKRFAMGTYVVWYPVIPRAESHDVPRKLKTLAQQAKRPWLHATLNIGQLPGLAGAAPEITVGPDGRALPDKRPGLRESGMFVINPPHTLKAELNAALPQILLALGRGRGKGFAVETGG